MTTRFIQLLSVVALSALVILSCQKEGSLETGTTAGTRPSSKDPIALSAAIKVWHGIRTPGLQPAPKGNALELEAPASLYTKAFAGRFAVIKPTILSGNVEGYYVSIDGAKEYFKVDYSKPRNMGRYAPGKKGSNPIPWSRMSGTGEAEDSAIVISFPATLKVPDTVCVTYTAYDALGNVSAPITTCIIIEKLGGDANSAWIHGTWQFNSISDNSFYDTIVVNKWFTYFNGRTLYCHYDAPNGEYFVRDNPDSANQAILAKDSVFRKYADMVFNADGSLLQNWHEAYKKVNESFSTCSTLVYDHEEHQDVNALGGWSFNSITNKLIIIMEIEKDGTPVGSIEEFDVQKVDNTHFIILDKQDPADILYIRMKKK